MRLLILFTILVSQIVCGCKQGEDFTQAEIKENQERQPPSFISFSSKSLELDGPASTDPSVAINAMSLMGGAFIQSFTFSFWFKMKSENPSYSGGYIRSNLDSENFFAIGWDSGTNTLVYVTVLGNFGPTTTNSITSNIEKSNEWNHVVFTYSHDASSVPTQSTMGYYLNGELVEEKSFNSEVFQLLPARKIEILPNGYNMDPSYIDEMAFWRKPLSSVEVQSVYGKGAPVNLNETINDYTAWWRMGENDSLPTVADESGNHDFDFISLPQVVEEFAAILVDPFAGENSDDPLNGDENGGGTSGGGGSDPLTGGGGGFGGEIGDGGSGGNFP